LLDAGTRRRAADVFDQQAAFDVRLLALLARQRPQRQAEVTALRCLAALVGEGGLGIGAGRA